MSRFIQKFQCIINLIHVYIFLSYSELKTLCRLEVVTTQQNKKQEVRDYAMQNGIAMRTWPVTFDTDGFHIGIVVSFGHLIPKKIINSFPL